MEYLHLKRKPAHKEWNMGNFNNDILILSWAIFCTIEKFQMQKKVENGPTDPKYPSHICNNIQNVSIFASSIFYVF